MELSGRRGGKRGPVAENFGGHYCLNQIERLLEKTRDAAVRMERDRKVERLVYHLYYREEMTQAGISEKLREMQEPWWYRTERQVRLILVGK
jgi:hypothetical protein